MSTGDRAGKAAFFEAVRAAKLPLDPPGTPGHHSWDSLDDSLWEGIRAADDPRVVVVWPDAHLYRHADPTNHCDGLYTLKRTAEDLLDERATVGRTREFCVYLTEGRD